MHAPEKALLDILKDPSVVQASAAPTSYENMTQSVEIDMETTAHPDAYRDVGKSPNNLGRITPLSVASSEAGSNLGGKMAKDKRAEFLDKREQEILDRERVLDDREDHMSAQLESSGRKYANNWPTKWYSVDFHDIAMDIPAQYQRCCKRAYHMWILTVFGLCWNLISVSLVMALSESVVSAPMERVLWAAIYMILGTVLSWTGWYKGLYVAIKSSSSVSWMKFWFMYALHILFVVYSIVGLPNWATSGVFNLLAQLGKGGSWTVIGFCAANIAIWSVIAILSLVVLRSARSAWNDKGGDQQMRSDARAAVVSELSRAV